MAYGFPGPLSVYIPTAGKQQQLTADMVVNYSRNIKKFLINSITQIIPVKTQQGFYLRVLPEIRASIPDEQMRDVIWNPGADRPTNPGNKLPYEYTPFRTTRYARGTMFPYETIDLADRDIKADHLQMLGQQLMTQRTVLGINTLLTGIPNTDTATNLGGGLLTAGTLNNRIIQKTLTRVRERILLSTVGMDGTEKLSLLINPNLARALAATEEIMVYKAQQEDSKDELEFKGSVDYYGLPKVLYGFRVLIDQTVDNPNGPTTTDVSSANTFVMPSDKAIVFYRPGDFVSDLSKGINSTLAMFTREEMKVETRDDNWNRRVEFSAVDEYQFQVAAPRTGFVITGCQ